MAQGTNQTSDTGPADRFADLAHDSSFWKSVDLRICAIRSGHHWVNLVTRGFLDHRAPRSVPRFSPVKRQDFRAWQVVRPIADLPAVVRGIADGMTKLRPRSVRYISRSDQPGTEMRCSFNEWTASYSAEYDLWSCHSLVGYGSSIWDVVTEAGHDPLELDGMIRGGPNPYDGLPDLVRRFCARLRGLEVRGTSTVVEVIAPLAVRFDPEAVTSSSEGITVGLKAANQVYVEKATIAWTAGAAGQPPRHGSRELRECKWARERGALHAELDIPVQEGDSTATLFILIVDRCVDRVSVPLAEAGSNIRIKAHNTVDPGLQRGQLPEEEELLPRVAGVPEWSVEDLLSEMESERVEFKSSAYYSYKPEVPERVVTESVLKTVAGFLNAGGGALAVGIADDGEILGIQPDLDIKNMDGDRYVNSLTNVIERSLGPLASTMAKIQLQAVDGVQVALVHVTPSPEPIYAKVSKRNRAFFVRVNNSTRVLEGADLVGYVNQRWA